ncbi:MAG: hypothetical protein RIS45_1568 [Planctomycetota bacterium]|jgi:hypothetical protein
MRPIPSQERLKELFDYDPASGQLIRRKTAEMSKTIAARFAGRPAGYQAPHGYVVVGIGRRLYYAHRIVWKWMYGSEPKEIDHVDGDGLNNRIANLRAATHGQNGVNKKTARETLPRGVCLSATKGKFLGRIGANGRKLHLGTFDTPAQAHEAYQRAARILHGEFARFD